MSELPAIAASSYASNTLDYTALLDAKELGMKAARLIAGPLNQMQNNPSPAGGIIAMANPSRRLVQVFIADPNDNISLDDSLLYRGEQKLTDLTDQELFFEVDIKTLLATHNEKRVKIVNKLVKDRTEYLEAAKIRDLKMVVTTIATF